MKKELLIWELITTALIISVFIGIFSLMNGWDLTGLEKYRITIIAAVSGIIVSAFFIVGWVMALIAGIIIAVISLLAGFIGPAVSAVVAIMLTAVITAFTAFIIADNKVEKRLELKNSFNLSFLILEILIIGGSLLTVTFFI